MEYIVEAQLFPMIHQYYMVTWIGVILVFLGEGIRKTGILTARAAFTHRIAVQKRPNHDLVQHGIYSIIRHPGYCGWMIWAVGTQMILKNPICVALFTIISWKFMSERIKVEEALLESFFGRDVYEAYRQRVPSGIPFVQ